MKKILIILLSVYVFTACNKDTSKSIDYEILTGNIQNAPVDKFSLSDLQNKKVAEIKLDEQGNFADTLHLPTSYYKLNMGNQYTWLYLKPGDNLRLELDYNDFDKTLTFSGKGADLNNYLAKKMLKAIELRPKTSYRYFGKLNEKDFVSLQDSIYKAFDELLKDINDEEFKDLEKFRNTVKKSVHISQYQPVKRYLTHNDSYEVPDDFPKAFDGIDINDERFLKIPNGEQYVSNYLGVLLSEKNGKDGYDPYDKLQMIDKEIKNSQLKESLALKEASYNLLYTDQLEAFYQLFDKMVKNDSLKQPVKEKYENIKSMSPGVPSPDFTAYDINGKEYHLKDFAGKALYIDLWATWCGPCRAEIPYLEKLKKQYKGKDINFLSLDVYDKKDKWEQMIKEKKMDGWQLINTDREMPFLKKYVVDGIPRFILLDKEGKIVDANAPRPSSGEELTGLIDKTIGK